VIGYGRIAVARRCSDMADGPERGLSRYRDYGLTRFMARDNDASSSEKMHRYMCLIKRISRILGPVLTR